MFAVQRFCVYYWHYIGLGFLVFSMPGYSKVQDTSSMAEALATVDAETLLVLDIDNTLIEASQALGSDQWYYHLVGRYQSLEKLSESEAYAKADKVWNEVQTFIPIRLVERNIADLLRDLQAKGVKTLVLTARHSDIAPVTLKQLASVRLNPDRSAPVAGDEVLAADGELKDPVHFKGGVIFSGERNDKGVVLVKFIRHHHLAPKRIVFVDDKLKHVTNVEKAVISELKIPCHAVRYGGADERVKAFDGQVADLEYQFLGSVLPDEAAAAIIKALPKDKLAEVVEPSALWPAAKF